MMWKQIVVMLSLLPFAAAGLAQGAQAPAYNVTARIAGPDGRWDLLGVDPTAPIPGTHRVLSTHGGANTATLFDGLTGHVIATLPTGTKPDAAVWGPSTRTVRVMTPGSGGITIVDPVAATVIDTIAVGGSLEPAAVDGKGRLYVNIEDKNEGAVLDTKARKVLSRFPLQGCEGPTGIAYAPDSEWILSACANGVAVVSAPDGHEVASLHVGQRPDGVLYDPQRHLAFVPSGGDGTLSVIRRDHTPEVIAQVRTAKGARTAALDRSTGRIYLPSAQYAPAEGNARPAMLPGNSEILVVSSSGNSR